VLGFSPRGGSTMTETKETTCPSLQPLSPSTFVRTGRSLKHSRTTWSGMASHGPEREKRWTPKTASGRLSESERKALSLITLWMSNKAASLRNDATADQHFGPPTHRCPRSPAKSRVQRSEPGGCRQRCRAITAAVTRIRNRGNAMIMVMHPAGAGAYFAY
jgi:hypothetical protein